MHAPEETCAGRGAGRNHTQAMSWRLECVTRFRLRAHVPQLHPSRLRIATARLRLLRLLLPLRVLRLLPLDQRGDVRRDARRTGGGDAALAGVATLAHVRRRGPEEPPLRRSAVLVELDLPTLRQGRRGGALDEAARCRAARHGAARRGAARRGGAARGGARRACCCSCCLLPVAGSLRSRSSIVRYALCGGSPRASRAIASAMCSPAARRRPT